MLFRSILNSEAWSLEICAFADRLAKLAGYAPGDPLAISTMGYEQILATLALTRLALDNGSRVILGGQYWTERTAKLILETVRSQNLTITTGDGYEAIINWYRGKPAPVNSFAWNSETIIKGERASALTQPPVPDYEATAWLEYDRYAGVMLGASRNIRRAHLYVWDKQCPHRCIFCRVSSGSNVKLSKPEQLAKNAAQLLRMGVRQMNFMTNELNPTLSYMRRLSKALKPILGGREDVVWFTYLRSDHMEPKDLCDLRHIGCRLARYGVETGSQKLSDRMRKGYSIEVIEQILKSAAHADILNHVNFLVGFPGETEKDVQETLDFIDRTAKHIHSARINPFYLPPGSPMALAPEKHGIRLKEFRRAFWDFELADGQRASADVVQDRIERITERLVRHGIGFSGVLPFETLDYLARHPDRDTALKAMRVERPYMWENSSSDWLKAKLSGYEMPTEWSATIYRRGQNYSLTLCND